MKPSIDNVVAECKTKKKLHFRILVILAESVADRPGRVIYIGVDGADYLNTGKISRGRSRRTPQLTRTNQSTRPYLFLPLIVASQPATICGPLGEFFSITSIACFHGALPSTRLKPIVKY